MVILITGKKGAGKSTYARKLKKELEDENFEVIWLDGDEFRKEKGNEDYSEEGRKRNLLEAALEAKIYEDQGYVVLMSFIMPTRELRKMIRRHVSVSRLVYLPGGTLWEGTRYEMPNNKEFEVKHNHVI